MATIGISEFTFGYAFLFEQTQANWPNLVAAPILPSLQQEQSVGWDAHLPLAGTDFYFQFKLADHLRRRNARFIADGTYNTAYYRVALHRKDQNRQHRRLREHAANNPNTYYVAPEFDTLEDFNSAFLSRQIVQRSRLIPLGDCQDIDDGDQHYITFQNGHSGWREHSEPKGHERSYSGEDLGQLYRGSEKQWVKLDERFAARLFEKTAQLTRRVAEEESPRIREPIRLLDFDPSTANRRDTLVRISEILSVVLGVTLVLVGARE